MQQTNRPQNRLSLDRNIRPLYNALYTCDTITATKSKLAVLSRQRKMSRAMPTIGTIERNMAEIN
jgi:hypothetical protein